MIRAGGERSAPGWSVGGYGTAGGIGRGDDSGSRSWAAGGKANVRDAGGTRDGAFGCEFDLGDGNGGGEY